jgi:hypothetical protein
MIQHVSDWVFLIVDQQNIANNFHTVGATLHEGKNLH